MATADPADVIGVDGGANVHELIAVDHSHRRRTAQRFRHRSLTFEPVVRSLHYFFGEGIPNDNIALPFNHKYFFLTR